MNQIDVEATVRAIRRRREREREEAEAGANRVDTGEMLDPVVRSVFFWGGFGGRLDSFGGCGGKGVVVVDSARKRIRTYEHSHTNWKKKQAQEMTPGIGLKYRVLNNKDVELGVSA